MESGGYQSLAGDVGVWRAQLCDDLWLGNTVSQSVGTKKQIIPRLERDFDRVDIEPFGGTDRAGNNVRLRMLPDSVRRQTSIIDKFLHDRMIARELQQIPCPQTVGPAIAHPRDRRCSTINECDHHCCAHLRNIGRRRPTTDGGIG